MCYTDNSNLPSYIPTERHSTLSVLNSNFSMLSFPVWDFSRPHTSPKCGHNHSTHRGHYRVHHTKNSKKSQLPAQQQEGLHSVFTSLQKVPPPTQRMAWGSAGLRRTREAWREHMWGQPGPSGRTRSHLSSTLWRREKREKVSVSGYFQM